MVVGSREKNSSKNKHFDDAVKKNKESHDRAKCWNSCIHIMDERERHSPLRARGNKEREKKREKIRRSVRVLLAQPLQGDKVEWLSTRCV